MKLLLHTVNFGKDEFVGPYDVLRRILNFVS